MAAQLERQQRPREQLVADVAHEPRTPVIVMRPALDAAQDGMQTARLAEQHGGSIRAESDGQRGTCIRLSLPAEGRKSRYDSQS